jgi:tetratricopeptide (TPR) repeat protein
MRTKSLMLVLVLVAAPFTQAARADEIDDLEAKADKASDDDDGDLLIAIGNRLIALNPNYGYAYIRRAEGYSLKGELEKSMADCNLALTFDLDAGGKCDAYVYRGSANAGLGNYEKGKSDFQQALQLDSAWPGALNSMAWLLATCPDEKFRDGKKAWELAKKAYELKPDWHHQDTLAAAYAECGDFDEAIRWQKKVVEDSHGTQKEKEERKERLKLYEQHKPFRDKPKTTK